MNLGDRFWRSTMVLEVCKMGRNASGMYVIDAEYNIVSYNHAAKTMYPELKKGEKCYQCLMKQDVPCENCPVANGIEGPENYLEPGSNMLRAIDAIEVELESGEMGHALVFSAAEATQDVYSELTNNGENPLLLGIVNVLGKNYTNIYSVNRRTHKISVCRFHNRMLGGVGESLLRNDSYDKVMDIYIEDNVAAEDKLRMHQAMDFEKICDRLRKVPQFKVHYRVYRNDTVYHYYVKCARIGEADSFEDVVLAFANEDSDVRHSEMESILEPGGTASRRKLLIIEDNELNRKLLTELLEDSYDVMTACDGEEGLKLLGENYRDISAVLLDVSMPICDGFQFLERIQDDVMLSSVPVIVITGSNRPEDEVRCLELGAVDFIRKPYNIRIVKGKINSVIKLRESAIVLSALEYDELTGIYIRQAFFHHAKTLMRFKQDEKFHVIVADVKNFKWINGTYGEKTGDQVLQYLADTYKSRIHNGMVARYGGDQFVTIMYGNLPLEAETVDKAIRRIEEEAPVPKLAVNYGIYKDVDKTLSLTLICDRAFLAMKSIQDDYEHPFAFYDDEMGRKHIRDRMMENEFEKAIRNEEFVVYLQPKYNVVTEEIAGAEALVRWRKKDGSMVSPGEFIPLYEKDGLIVRLDEYVFQKVCEIQKNHMETGGKLLPISVNLSRASIHYENMILRYVRIVEERGIPFSAVPIELTETAALYNVQIRELTEKMVHAGFELHMDDFGSGYSSMTSLNQLPFDTLKLDKSLIDYIENTRGMEVIRHTIALAHSLGMQVLAEGVETAGQVALLRELDCDEIQGFYYSRPVPWEEFVDRFMKKSDK